MVRTSFLDVVTSTQAVCKTDSLLRGRGTWVAQVAGRGLVRYRKAVLPLLRQSALYTIFGSARYASSRRIC